MYDVHSIAVCERMERTDRNELLLLLLYAADFFSWVAVTNSKIVGIDRIVSVCECVSYIYFLTANIYKYIVEILSIWLYIDRNNVEFRFETIFTIIILLAHIFLLLLLLHFSSVCAVKIDFFGRIQ